MAGRVGKPPGLPKSGGRKIGSVNKKTVEFQKILEEKNFSPAEALIWCFEEARKIFEYRKKNGNLEGALNALDRAESAASDLAQYSYPKKKAVEHSGEVGVKTFADFILAGEKASQE